MPGLCGVGSRAGAADNLRAMLPSLSHYPWHRGEQWHDDACALGRVVAGGTPVADESGMASAGGGVVMLDGEVYRENGESRTAAQILADGVATGGAGFLRSLKGCFSAAIWNASEQTLTVVTDRFGMRPVYWTHRPGRLAFAAEIKALLTDGDVPRSLSERGVSEFFAFGQLMGESTLYSAIHALPPAAWLRWDARTDRVTLEQFADLSTDVAAATDGEWLELIGARLTTAVARACGDTSGLGLSLSGGLDARTILGVAPEGVRLDCLSLGVPGGIDHRSAARLAQIAGQVHHRQLLDGDFLSRFSELLQPVVRLTDGHYLDQGIVYSTLQMYRDLGVRVLLRGHAGELMHMRKAYAFSMDAAAASLETPAQLVDWLWAHLTHFMIGEAHASVFTQGVAVGLRDVARDSLQQAANRCDGVQPVPQRIWRMFVRERLHRETALSLHMFRSFVEVRVPFLDADLIEAILAAPVHLKVGDTIQTQVLRTHRPAFLSVINSNTGAPMGAPAWQEQLAHLRMRVLAKLGVPGYQPYERLGLWLARELHPLLRATLLSDQFLDRGIFSRSAVERLLGEHARRERNHTYLLQAMLVFEQGQRELGT